MVEAQDIERFLCDGVVVIEDILSGTEVEEARQGLHEYLLEHGVDHSALDQTGHKLASLSSVGGAGGVLDIFHAPFKLKVAEHPRVVAAVGEIWNSSYAGRCHDDLLWVHPFGEFQSNSPLMAIDRVCYRVPDRLSAVLGTKRRPLQRCLAAHLDLRCDGFGTDSNLPEGGKWRPIQGFVALTDCLEPNHGGFECCRGFHRQFSKFVRERKGSHDHTYQGAFTPMRPAEDMHVFEQLSHVPCKAGSLVLWDYRLPHACSQNIGTNPREVIYISLLPRVQRNIEYVRNQLHRFNEGQLPVDFWGGRDERQQHAQEYQFSELGRSMMGMEGL